MTTPAPPPQPAQQAASAAQAALALDAATALLDYTTITGLFAALRVPFRRAGVSDTALLTTIQIIASFPPERIEGIGPATRWASRANLARRATFFVNAARRVQDDIIAARAKGEPVTGAVIRAIEDERRFFRQHVAASQGRTAAGARVDAAWGSYGDVLGWKAVKDPRTSPECLAADGKNFHAATPPLIGYPGTVHPSCFPPGTKIVASSVAAATSRGYAGEFVQIITADGHDLTVTPNHPVLTSQGWVAAGLIHKGSYVARALDPAAACALADPDEHHVVAMIEDALRPGSNPVSMVIAAMPVSPVDFHGDGHEHQVAVVRADRELMNRLQIGQPGGVQHLSRVAGRLAMPVVGQQFSDLWGAPCPPDGCMSSFSVARILLGSPPAHHQPVGVGAASDGNTMTAEEPGNGYAGNIARFSERFERFASQVTFDEVVTVRRVPAGVDSRNVHVHNLQTVTGWYTANSIVVHNCRCLPVRAYPGASFLPTTHLAEVKTFERPAAGTEGSSRAA